MKLEFEFDPVKSASNLVKHGMDFVTAQLLWDDPYVAKGVAEQRGERREMLFASLEGKIWTVVFVQRERRLRIISARRSRVDEGRVYEQGKS